MSGEEGSPQRIGVDPHDVLGRVPTDATLRRELAAVARSRGRESSYDEEIASIAESIAAVEIPDVDLRAARERVAEATAAEEGLEERVAAARGDVRARREVDADPTDALAELEDAAAALSSARTERVAAEQALDRQRERVAAARDARERRLRLRDRLENRRRDARRELARALYPEFREALAAIPGGDPADAAVPAADAEPANASGPATTRPGPSTYDGPALSASLAAVRIADLEKPVVLSSAAADAFASRDGTDPAAEPESVLDAPVVRPDS